MTLPGGPAAKLGHMYEKWWTLSELVRMLRGETDSLRIEPPGLDGVEFVVKSGNQQEFHQAKRSHRSGRWSQATLASSGVLGSIGKLLIGNRDRFVFVSGSDARELTDLCEGAAHAESFDEFKARFLGAEPRASSYERVLNEWHCDGRVAWDVLCRVDVHTISERLLETTVRRDLSALFLARADQLCARLATIVEAVHRTIERPELLSQLKEAGFLLRKVSSAHTARQAVADATDRYLQGVRRNLIQGSLIPRDKTDEIVARLTGAQPADCVLTGKAGGGKTGCVVEVVEKLKGKGVRVLAFRLDRHMSETSATGLGKRLELEESPALVLSAAAKFNGAPAVLIVDQLDAVSAMSGWDSQAFDVVEQLLTEAKAGGIGTMVVCRAFDWHNDPRLRSLIREDDREVKLDKLSPDEVQNVLAKGGLDASTFSTRQLDLLRLPQNLALFFNANTSPSTAFSSDSDLLKCYWDKKRRLVAERAGQDDRWIEVMGAMCEAINDTQQLSVREEKLDGFSPSYLDQFVSEGVLAKDGHSYAFGHESFFDYCFARLFANKETSLTTLLKSSEQHLFRRSQVRQVLVYLREADFDRYVKELEALVSNEGIRAHIKDLVFAWLATLDDPHDEEWNIWIAFVEPQLPAIEQRACEDRLIMRAWQRIFSAKSWFKQFDKREMISDWLSGQEHHVDLATAYLCSHQGNWPDEVAACLEPFADLDGDWSRRLRTVMFHPDSCRSRRHFDLFLKLLDKGTLDSGHGAFASIGEVCYRLQNKQPNWIPEVLAHQLRRLCATATAGSDVYLGVQWLDAFDGDHISGAIRKAADLVPATFVGYVLPAVLDLADAASGDGQRPPITDVVWPVLRKGPLTVMDSCLHALAGALTRLAGGDEDLREWVGMLASRETHVANYLLLAIYRGGGARYADKAALAFCKNPWRFHCGYSDSPYWCATETLKAIVPHCQADNLAALEGVILSYEDAFEQTKDGIRSRGQAVFNLLAAFPDELRSDLASSRFQEMRRRFGDPSPAPRGIVSGWAESPIPSAARAKMNDEQWLKAIAAHPSNPQLAREFGAEVKIAPDRFVGISDQMPSATNPIYFSELLGGLAEATIAEDTKVAVCQRVFEYARVECGRDIAKLLATANRPLPDGALDILVRLAIETEGSEDEKWWLEDVGDDHFDLRSDIYTKGINTTRGRAALSLGELISKDGGYISRLEPVLSELVGVRSAAIGSCVAYTLRTVAYHDQALGVDLFLRMDFSEERLLGTHHVHEFVRENVHGEFAKMRGLIVRMLRSRYPDVRRPGARLGCLAGLSHQDALELAEESRRGDIHQRRGSAEVAAANISEPQCRPWCESALGDFFADDDPEVRKVAASCFRHIHEDDLATCGDLIGAFCNKPAFEDDSFSLLRALKNARAQLPGMTHLACERLLKRTERRGTDTMTAIELVFRLYQQHPNDKWTKRCLDLIDLVCLEEPGSAWKRFDDFER